MADKDEFINGNSSRAKKTVINLSENNKSRNLTYMPNIRAIKKPTFLTFNIKKAFNYLKQTFFKPSIFWHFNLKSHIII